MTRTTRRALAGACALTLLFAACGDDDDSAETVDDTEQTTEAADESTTTEADDETSTTEADDEGASTTTEADEPDDDTGGGTEGDPDAVALAQRINLTLGDFAEGWTEEPPEDDDGGPSIDDCFVETDIESVTVGEAETGTFSIEPDADTVQLVTMQTVVLDSPETAEVILAEAGGDAFVTCIQDNLGGGLAEGAELTLSVLPDDPAYTEESFGLAGDVVIPTDAAPAYGAMDLHLFRTGEVVSFTATIDIGDVGLEATLGELYPVIADRHATELG